MTKTTRYLKIFSGLNFADIFLFLATGYCGCTLQDFQVETCNDIGQVVTPDPTGLCNILLNSPILSTSNTYVGWKDLALTSCALLDTTKTLCYRVDTSGGTQRISAATAIVGFDFVTSGIGRRLLTSSNQDLPENNTFMSELDTVISNKIRYMLWNASWSSSGEPCSSLVHAYRLSSPSQYQSTSIMDRHMLKHCLHVRMAGNSTLEKYAPNYTKDDFILSYQGMADAFTDATFMQGMVIQNFPRSFLYLASFGEWAEPVLQTWNSMESFAMDSLVQFINVSISKNRTSSLNVTKGHFSRKLDKAKKMIKFIVPFMHSGSMFVSNNINTVVKNITRQEDALFNQPPLNQPPPPGNNQRRLLQYNVDTASIDENENQEITWKDNLTSIPIDGSIDDSTITMVQMYSTLIGLGSFKESLLPTDLANRWKTGPFNWPFSVVEDEGTDKSTDFYYCPVGQDAANVIVNAFASLHQQLTSPPEVPSFESARVSRSFPRIHYKNPSLFIKNKHLTLPLGTFANISIDSNSSIATTTLGYIIGFFVGNTSESDSGYTASRILKETFVCQFDKVVMKCQSKRTSLVAGAISIFLIIILYCIALGSSAPIFLSFVSITLLILWNVYGYSPACVPLIPPCIVEDVFAVLKWFVPLQMEWPEALQIQPNCAFNSSIPYEECFVSCKASPYNYGDFQGWEASLAWLFCDWDPYWCSTDMVSWSRSMNLPDSFVKMLQQKSDMLISSNYPPNKKFIDAQRFCFASNLIYLIPYVFIFLLVFYGIYAVLLIPFVFFQSLVDFGLNTLVFIHMQHANGNTNNVE